MRRDGRLLMNRMFYYIGRIARRLNTDEAHSKDDSGMKPMIQLLHNEKTRGEKKSAMATDTRLAWRFIPDTV